MASTKPNLAIFRGIIREFRRIYGKEKIYDAPAYTYLKDQYQKHNLTSEKYCRDKMDLIYQANTYLLYLQSTRKHQSTGLNIETEISDYYKGSGERGIEETAKMVGFLLPQTPTNDRK